MIKEIIHQEDITLNNLCAYNLEAAKYIKQLVTLKGRNLQNTIIVGNLNITLIAMGRSSKQSQLEKLALNEN